jgi:hypothetical protein
MINIKPSVMNKPLHISTALDQPGLLENMVEKLVSRSPDYGITGIKMPRGLVAIDSSSTEAFVNGNVELRMGISPGRKEYIRMPFITSFYFTCIKSKNSPFRLAWSNSLS